MRTIIPSPPKKVIKEVPKAAQREQDKKLVKITLNGHTFYYPDKQVISVCLERFVPDLGIMSNYAMLNLMETAAIMAADAGLGGPITRTANLIVKKIENFREKIDKGEVDQTNDIITYFAEIVMRSEGHGLLPGFGFQHVEVSEGRRRTKGPSVFNPEIKSILTEC